MIKRIKTGLGRIFAPVSRGRKLGDAGQGGGGGFAGVADEWTSPHVKGGILLGQSLQDPSWRVGLAPGKHLITVASTGSGKDRTRVQTVLLDFPGSVIVADIGGSNAAVTGYARGHGGGRVRKGMGQDVRLLNPSNLHAGAPGMPPSSRFEPFSTVDLKAPDVVEQIDAISEGLIPPNVQGDPHWADSARDFWSVLTGYTLTAPLDEREGVRARGILEARRLLTLPNGPPLERMVASEALRGMVSRRAAQMKVASDREFSGILSTAIRQTSWLESHEIQDTFSGSDFNLLDLKRQPSTLFLIEAAHKLAERANFLRLFFSLMLSAASRVGASGVPMLFIMNEFFSVGRQESMEKAAANIRKNGIVLWPILQNLSQARIYGDAWETFVANAHLEVFGVNDLTTARYASDLLGHTVVQRRDRDGVMRPAAVAPLRDPAELAHEVAPDGGRMIVFRGGPPPFLLKRLNYDRIYSKSQYNPDPAVPGS